MTLSVDGVDIGGAYSGTGGGIAYGPTGASMGFSAGSTMNGRMGIVYAWDWDVPLGFLKLLALDPFGPVRMRGPQIGKGAAVAAAHLARAPIPAKLLSGKLF